MTFAFNVLVLMLVPLHLSQAHADATDNFMQTLKQHL